MPSPGQRPGRSAATSAQRGDVAGDAPVPVDALIPARSINPLIAAASPLLNAIPSLRASLDNPDPAALRDRLADGIRAFFGGV